MYRIIIVMLILLLTTTLRAQDGTPTLESIWSNLDDTIAVDGIIWTLDSESITDMSAVPVRRFTLTTADGRAIQGSLGVFEDSTRAKAYFAQIAEPHTEFGERDDNLLYSNLLGTDVAPFALLRLDIIVVEFIGEAPMRSLAEAYIGMVAGRNAERLTARALEALREGSPWESISLLNTIINNGGESAIAYEYRAYAYSMSHHYQHASVDLKKALDYGLTEYHALPEWLLVQESDASLVYLRGRAYHDAGALDFALRDYNSALELFPTYADALFSRGQTYLDMGNYERALADFDAAIAARDTEPAYYFYRGIVHSALNNVSAAVMDFSASYGYIPDIELDEVTTTYYRQGILEVDLRRDEAMRLNPHYELGLAYFNAGNYDLALAALNTAIEHGPTSGDMYYTLALTQEQYPENRYRLLDTFAQALEAGLTVQDAAYARVALEMAQYGGVDIRYDFGGGYTMHYSSAFSIEEESPGYVKISMNSADAEVEIQDAPYESLDDFMLEKLVERSVEIVVPIRRITLAGREAQLLEIEVTSIEAFPLWDIYIALTLNNGSFAFVKIHSREGRFHPSGVQYRFHGMLTTMHNEEGFYQVETDDEDCDGLLPALLTPYSRAAVSEEPGTRNNVRSEPSATSPLLAQIEPGTTFYVLQGYVCVDGFRWWRIHLDDGITGWTVDGDNEDYWLIPV